MINEIKASKVRKGEAAIEHTVDATTFLKLQNLLHDITYPIFTNMISTLFKYYYINKEGIWMASPYLPSGMEAIPLNKFFVEEREEVFDLKSENFGDFMEADIIDLVPFSLVELQEMYIELLIKELNEVVGVAAIHGWKSHNVEEGERLRNLIEQAKQKEEK